MFDKIKFRAAINKRSLIDKNVANILGITKQALSLKMQNKTRWTVDDIDVLKRTIGLTDKEISDIFFDYNVDKLR